MCGVGAVVRRDGTARVALVSVGAGPVLVELERPTEADAVRGSVDAAIEPEDDIHASADYRRHLAHVLVRSRPHRGRGARRMSEATVPVSFTVNGVPHELELAPRRLLSDALRHDLRLTGTHVGCEHGVCGACTVLVDGAPVRSCLLFACHLDGAAITTTEGLRSADGGMGPVQQAFHECHALQCGFCTPGFVTTVTAFLDEQPGPDPGGGARGDLRQPVPLHRLRQHRRRGAARRRAGRRDRACAGRRTVTTQACSGSGSPRVEDARLVTGDGRFLDDLGHDALEAAFVRSPHAHARIVDVDVTGALDVDGLVAIYTYDDLEADTTSRVAEPLPLLIPHPTLTHGRTPYALARDEVNHVGEAVVMVVATTATSPRTCATGSAWTTSRCRRWSASSAPGTPPTWCTRTCRATWPP